MRIRHARLGRRVVARVEDVLVALDRVAEEADAPEDSGAESADGDSEPATVDEVLRRLGRRRT